jgi:transposase
MTDSVLGIDIAKRSFHVALLRPGLPLRRKAFDNRARDHQQLVRWLEAEGGGRVHACLEATGPYGDALARHLYEHGHIVSIVNPAAVKAYGRSELSRSKTDKSDAALIARFCATHRPRPWTPLAPDLQHLQSLVRRATDVVHLRQQEARRLQSVRPDPVVLRSIRQLLTYLDRQLAQLRRQIRDHIQQSPTLRAQHDLLVSIPGIATVTAAALLAELTDVTRFASARQVAAFAGLVPRIQQSGTSVRSPGHLCKMGPGRLRSALYFPAVTALRVNPVFQALKVRLRARGKLPLVIIAAAMRKLLHVAYGVLKSGRPFELELAKAA